MNRNPWPPLSLYVHLPWCVRKCPYCDFNSWPAGDDAPRGRYLAALRSDLAAEAERAAGRPLLSVFLGGGTPSLFTPAEIASLLGEVDRLFGLDAGVEVTMEANPGTIEFADPAGYRAAGVNRLSIGAQSFDERQLATLGRVHGAKDTARAVRAARKAGFDNINLDLMYALPQQRPADAVDDVSKAAALGPEHISWYQLTLEPNTVFHARPPAGLPDDDTADAIQRAGEALLEALGYARYEVSAWSRPGRQCRHNLNYWTFGDYLAAGAGAHGKITTAAGVFRYAKPAHPRAYMQQLETAAPPPETVAVEADELLFEFMLNASRLSAGFDESLFTGRTGLPAAMLRSRLLAVAERGLVECDRDGHWRPTGLGQRFLNDLQGFFLPPLRAAGRASAAAAADGFMHSTGAPL